MSDTRHAPGQPSSTADDLHTPDDVAAYLDAALEDGHPDVMLLALPHAGLPARRLPAVPDTATGTIAVIAIP